MSFKYPTIKLAYFYSIVFLLAVTFACSKKAVPTTEPIIYESLGNSAAYVRLTLNPDNTLAYYMKIIVPRSGEADEIEAQGDWTLVDEHIELNFDNPEFDLNTVFNESFAEGEQYEIIDDNTVRFDQDKKSLVIWGILCERQ